MREKNRTFLILWAGQVVSIFGSALTSFALGVWVFQTTGSVTRFALISFFAFMPGVAMLPIAGAIVDRFDRRRVMILSDTGAALGTMAIAALLRFDLLEIWHLYVLISWISICNSPQLLAFQSSIPLLVEKKNLSRANGMYQLGGGLAEIGAPLLAGLLVVSVPLWSILVIDFSTFVFAAASLLIIRLPSPAAPEADPDAAPETPRQRLTAGWSYLRAHVGFLGLAVFFSLLNANRGATIVLLTPLVLSMASPAALGVVHALGAAGMVFGGVLMTIWVGPRKRIPGIFAATVLYGVMLTLGGLRPDVVLVGTAAFLLLVCGPVINSLGLTTWQSKVPLHLQGRVFAARRVIISLGTPVGMLVAGPVSDRFFEPAMTQGGWLAPSLGAVWSVGPGRGVGLLMSVLGLLAIAQSFAGWLFGPLRRLDTEVPDTAE